MMIAGAIVNEILQPAPALAATPRVPAVVRAVPAAAKKKRKETKKTEKRRGKTGNTSTRVGMFCIPKTIPKIFKSQNVGKVENHEK